MKFSLTRCWIAGVILAVLCTPCESPAIIPPRRLVIAPTPGSTRPCPTVSEAVIGPARSVALIEPPRDWILPAATWKSMNDSRFAVDVAAERGREYVGIRYMIPFGS